MDDFDISPRYEESAEDIDGDDWSGTPDMTVSVWKRDIGPKTFMFTSVQRPDSAHINVSEEIRTYEHRHAIGFRRDEAGPRPD